MTRYLYRRAVGGLFHVDEGWARSLLPPSLSPLGARLGSAMLSLVVFDFVQSEAGPFTELASMLLVPPDVRRGEPFPEVGLYPHLLCTSSQASRVLARDRLRLPVDPTDIEARFERDGDRERVEVLAGGERVLALAVTRRHGRFASRLFQCFTMHDQLQRAPVRMEGWVGEHEEETGRLELGSHPLVAGLARALADEVPFREQVVEGGQEDFGEMVPR
jgi:hypothetical protein